MKNKLLSLVVVSSFILLPMATFAEEAGFQAGQGDREGRREALQNKKGEIKDSIRERKDNAVDQIQNRLNKFIQNVIDRFDAAVERLEQLTLRIESRIAKLDTESVNTAKAKELLVIAKSKIQIAKTSISLIQFATTTATSTASTTPSTNKDVLKAIFKITQSQIEKAKTDIKTAHRALISVIENLKPGRNGKGNATSTASTTPNNN